MPNPQVVGVAPIARYVPNPTPYFDVPVVNATRDDIVVVWYWSLDISSTTTAPAAFPGGWTENHNVFTTGGAKGVAHRKVTEASLSSVRITNYRAHSTAFYAATYTVRYANAYVDFDYNAGSTSSASFPAMTVATPNSLAVHGVMTVDFFTNGTWPAIDASGWANAGSSRLPQPAGSFGLDVVHTLAQTNIPATDWSWLPASADTFGWDVFSFLFEPLAVLTLPTLPSPTQLRLDCMDSYSVFITDASYRTTLDKVPCSSVTCERVLDEISTASVTVPDQLVGMRCSSTLAGLLPWRYGLLIERNDQQIWSGVVTSLNRDTNAGTLTIGAADVLQRQMLNYAIWGGERLYKDVDAGIVFRDVVNTHSFRAANPWTMVCPDFLTDHPMTRAFHQRRLERCWTVLQELLESAVDAFVMNGLLYCWSHNEGWVYHNGSRTVVLDGPYNRFLGFEYGTFTNESFTTLPSWSISGMDQANYIDAPHADTGEKGFRTIFNAQDPAGQALDGLLVFMDPNTMHRPDESAPAVDDAAFQLRADSLLALRHQAPAVMSGGSLAEGAPIDVENLRPGAIWRIDVHDRGYRQLLQVGILKRVEFKYSGGARGTEQILPTIIPVGYQEGA